MNETRIVLPISSVRSVTYVAGCSGVGVGEWGTAVPRGTTPHPNLPHKGGGSRPGTAQRN